MQPFDLARGHQCPGHRFPELVDASRCCKHNSCSMYPTTVRDNSACRALCQSHPTVVTFITHRASTAPAHKGCGRKQQLITGSPSITCTHRNRVQPFPVTTTCVHLAEPRSRVNCSSGSAEHSVWEPSCYKARGHLHQDRHGTSSTDLL